MLTSCVMSWPHQFLCKKETWKNPNNRWKAVELPNIDRERESLCIAWTTRRVSMNFSGKMWLIIIAKVCKSQGFTLSLEGKFLKRLQGGGGGAGVKQTAPDFLELKNPSPAQFLTSLNSHRYYWVLKLLIVTWKSEAWVKHRARLYSLS